MSAIDDQTHLHAEDGIFSPPEPLPNPADLSNGSAGNQLRYGILNLNDEKIVKQFNQVLRWFKDAGAPTEDYIFFTPVLTGGFGSTQIIFSDAEGRVSAHDATHLYNDPETAMTQLRFAHSLPVKAGYINFPGFDVIDQQNFDPVGLGLPGFNTPGWARPFPRYYSVSPDFTEAKYPRGARYLRVATDEEFVRDVKIAGWKPNPTGFGMIVDLKPVWERIR